MRKRSRNNNNNSSSKSQKETSNVRTTQAIESVCMRPVQYNEINDLVLTPLQVQITSLRQSVPPNIILFVACGYKAKVFGRDAFVVSRRCGVCCIPAHPFQYASCPYTRVNLYIHRLVAMGYHVVFADQESAAIRAVEKVKSKVFTRSLSRIYSRATLLPNEYVGGANVEITTKIRSQNEYDNSSQLQNNNTVISKDKFDLVQNNYGKDNNNNNNNNSNDNKDDDDDDETNTINKEKKSEKYIQPSKSHHSKLSDNANLSAYKRKQKFVVEDDKQHLQTQLQYAKLTQTTQLSSESYCKDEDDNNNNYNNHDDDKHANDNENGDAVNSQSEHSDCFICFLTCTYRGSSSVCTENMQFQSSSTRVILLSFVTQQYINADVTSALQFDDLLSNYEIVQFVVLLRTICSHQQQSSSPPLSMSISSTSNCKKHLYKDGKKNKFQQRYMSNEKQTHYFDKQQQGFSYHLKYRSNEGYSFLPLRQYFNALPQYIKSILSSNYKLNYGPSRSGVEDNNTISFNGFPCLKKQKWDDVVQDYLSQYGLGEMYTSMRTRCQLDCQLQLSTTNEITSTNHSQQHCQSDRSNLQSCTHQKQKVLSVMTLPGNTLRALDVFSYQQKSLSASSISNNQLNMSDWSSNTYSLFHFLDLSQTACGKRLLHRWVASPLVCLHDILCRQNAVTFLVNNDKTYTDQQKSINKQLHINEQGDVHYSQIMFANAKSVINVINNIISSARQAGDVESVVSKMQAKRCTVREFVRLLQLIEQIYTISTNGMVGRSNNDTTKSHQSVIDDVIPYLIAQQLKTLKSIAIKQLITKYKSIIIAAPLSPFQFFMINAHQTTNAFHKQITDIKHAQQRLKRQLSNIRKIINLPQLQYRTIGGTPFVIDLPSTCSRQVPSNWTVLTRTKTNIRYHTSQIVQSYTALSAANARAAALAIIDWQNYQKQFVMQDNQQNLNTLTGVIEAISILDALHSLAKASARAGYVKPVLIQTNDSINVTNPLPPIIVTHQYIQPSQHTATTTLQTAHLIKHHCTLMIDEGRHPLMDVLLQHRYVASSISMQFHGGWILTGPNMGGKSALMRMLGLFVILAQIGCYVPARRATLPLFTAIYCRMGASDAILEGSSTFLNQMNETARILRSPNLRTSLVLMDELGRGTSSFDGAAVAAATLSYLREHDTTFLFVTHFNYICKQYLHQTNSDYGVNAWETSTHNKMTNNELPNKIALHNNHFDRNMTYDQPTNGKKNDISYSGAKDQSNRVECFYMGFRKNVLHQRQKQINSLSKQLSRKLKQHQKQKYYYPQSAKSNIIFTYQPVKGITPSSFGVDVAAMAGLPSSLLTQAHALSSNAENVQNYRSALHHIKLFMQLQ